MLLLCGDIVLNPGPIIFTCTVWEECVKSNQRALSGFNVLTRVQSSNICLGIAWLFCMLLLYGNIVTNPGPVCYPCTVCSRSVNLNHVRLSVTTVICGCTLRVLVYRNVSIETCSHKWNFLGSALPVCFLFYHHLTSMMTPLQFLQQRKATNCLHHQLTCLNLW